MFNDTEYEGNVISVKEVSVRSTLSCVYWADDLRSPRRPAPTGNGGTKTALLPLPVTVLAPGAFLLSVVELD